MQGCKTGNSKIKGRITNGCIFYYGVFSTIWENKWEWEADCGRQITITQVSSEWNLKGHTPRVFSSQQAHQDKKAAKLVPGLILYSVSA